MVIKTEIGVVENVINLDYSLLWFYRSVEGRWRRIDSRKVHKLDILPLLIKIQEQSILTFLGKV